MNPLSRRAWLRQVGVMAALATLPKSLSAQTSLPPATSGELAAMERIAQEFMEKFQVPGLSVAIGRGGKLLYEKGFGYADTKSQELVTPDHLFRIASVSKPITAVAIFALIEQGKLHLHDHVFGGDALLPVSSRPILSDRLKAIKVYHLLTHTCGGWDNSSMDPMFEQALMDQHQLIEWTLRTRALEHPPGMNYAYSNFGYCVLGRIVEKVTGQPYETWVQDSILKPCGVTTMQIAGNRLADRKPGEAVYYDAGPGNPYGMNVRRMDSHGGWLATARDLVRFAQRVDGFDPSPDILTAESIKHMTTPSAANPNYACGWAVNSQPNWWHTGSLPGTITILARTGRGLCWAGLINTRTKGVGLALDRLMWKLARAVPAWKA